MQLKLLKVISATNRTIYENEPLPVFGEVKLGDSLDSLYKQLKQEIAFGRFLADKECKQPNQLITIIVVKNRKENKIIDTLEKPDIQTMYATLV